MVSDYHYNRQLEEADEAQTILEDLVGDLSNEATCECGYLLKDMDWGIVDYEFAKYHYNVDIAAECPECGMDYGLNAYDEANFEPHDKY